MTLRIVPACTIGVAAALTVGLAAAAGAQATTKPQTSIPITKEAPGEVIPTKVDTITLYQTDTTRVFTTDTVRLNVPGPVVTNTVTQVDTVMIHPELPAAFVKAGFYLGLGMGPALPFGSLQSVNNPAVSSQLNIGWQGLSNFLGLRLDENYSVYSDASDFYGGLGPHPQVFNTNLDAKLQLPGLTHLFGYAPRFTVYAIGGASNSYYHNLRVEANPGQGTVGPLNAMPLDASWTSHWGYNVGGGVSFHWRETELFAESRVIAFNMSNAPTARQIPIMFGVDWY